MKRTSFIGVAESTAVVERLMQPGYDDAVETNNNRRVNLFPRTSSCFEITSAFASIAIVSAPTHADEEIWCDIDIACRYDKAYSSPPRLRSQSACRIACRWLCRAFIERIRIDCGSGESS